MTGLKNHKVQAGVAIAIKEAWSFFKDSKKQKSDQSPEIASLIAELEEYERISDDLGEAKKEIEQLKAKQKIRNRVILVLLAVIAALLIFKL